MCVCCAVLCSGEFNFGDERGSLSSFVVNVVAVVFVYSFKIKSLHVPSLTLQMSIAFKHPPHPPARVARVPVCRHGIC